MNVWYFLCMTSFIHRRYSEGLYRTTTISQSINSIDPPEAGKPTSSNNPHEAGKSTSLNSLPEAGNSPTFDPPQPGKSPTLDPPQPGKLNPSTNSVIHKGLTCLENQFNFTIQFERPFSGVIYTEGAELLSRCVYVEGWKDSRMQYQFLIPMDGCGSINTRNGSAYQTTNTFLVQRDPRLIQLNDNAFTIVCQRYFPINRDPDDDSSPSGSITAIYERYEVAGPTEEVITRSVNEIIGKEVQFGTKLALGDDPEGPLPNRPVQLGERLTYVFYCSVNGSNGEKKDCTVGECIATDPGGVRKVELSDRNGCSKHPTVWSNFMPHSANFANGIEAQKVLLSRLSAWSFPTSTHVLISCKARSCDGACPNRPDSCSSIELTPMNGLETINDTVLFNRDPLQANDADARIFDEDSRMVLNDAIVGYKVDRSKGYVSIDRPLCVTPSNQNDPPLSQSEMITVQSSSSTNVLSPVPILPPQQRDTDSGQLTARSVSINRNKNCLSMDVFVGVVSALLTGLGIMSFVVGYLMWKLHKCNKKPSVVRIEKRSLH